MCRTLVGAGLLLVVLGPAAATTPADAQVSDRGCNVRLKGLKTLSDPERNLVNLSPKNTTAAAINALPQPYPTPKTRTTDFSRHVWRVTAQIIKFKLEGDSDIKLVLFDENAYLIAEMPVAQCLPKKARRRFSMAASMEEVRVRRLHHHADEYDPDQRDGDEDFPAETHDLVIAIARKRRAHP